MPEDAQEETREYTKCQPTRFDHPLMRHFRVVGYEYTNAIERQFSMLAETIHDIQGSTDSPSLTTALVRLLESRDAALRARSE